VRKALAIVLVVALYSSLETVFLLSILTPYLFGFRYDMYQAFVGWSQLLVIPGLAALFSRLMYGAQGWRKRCIKTALAGALGLPLLLTVVGSVGAAIAWAASVNVILAVVFFVVLGGGFILGMIWIAGRMNRRSVPIEAARWLEGRQLKPIDRKRRSQGIRLALWIPSLTVLLVGTFLLPIWGVLSHAIRPKIGNFGRFQVPVPLTSVVLYSDRDPIAGDAWASFLSGRGSPLVSLFYPGKGLRLSEWGFRIHISTDPSKTVLIRPPKYEEITNRRQLLIGRERVECLEYASGYLRRWNIAEYSSTIFARCDGAGPFSASFGGDKTQLPAFYEILEGTKERE